MYINNITFVIKNHLPLRVVMDCYLQTKDSHLTLNSILISNLLQQVVFHLLLIQSRLLTFFSTICWYSTYDSFSSQEYITNIKYMNTHDHIITIFDVIIPNSLNIIDYRQILSWCTQHFTPKYQLDKLKFSDLFMDTMVLNTNKCGPNTQ